MDPLVVSDITAALYLALLASGTDGPPDTLEWEVLTTAGAELTVLDPADADLAEAARMTISSAVADLIADDTFPPRPGKICSTCRVAPWCRTTAARRRRAAVASRQRWPAADPRTLTAAAGRPTR